MLKQVVKLVQGQPRLGSWWDNANNFFIFLPKSWEGSRVNEMVVRSRLEKKMTVLSHTSTGPAPNFLCLCS